MHLPGPALSEVIGQVPYRMALAGGWIDQPFVSRHDPSPPGSMVVVGLEPVTRYMDRAGMATGTRQVALRLWAGQLPARDPAVLVRELYAEENRGKTDPSGSQDMIGLIYPGVNRLDYDYGHEGGVFPRHIESLQSRDTAAWLEQVLHVLPVAARPEGYNPLGVQNIEPEWVRRLGESGRACFEAIKARDVAGLGSAMSLCMDCWDRLLPHTLEHPLLQLDLKALLRHYRTRYAGAAYSGCGGGYLFVVSEIPVAGAFRVRIRV